MSGSVPTRRVLLAQKFQIFPSILLDLYTEMTGAADREELVGRLDKIRTEDAFIDYCIQKGIIGTSKDNSLEIVEIAASYIGFFTVIIKIEEVRMDPYGSPHLYESEFLVINTVAHETARAASLF